ncbi:MAG: hypothetical protein ACRDJN_08845 [Chloroflexota bacterium]
MTSSAQAPVAPVTPPLASPAGAPLVRPEAVLRRVSRAVFVLRSNRSTNYD